MSTCWLFPVWFGLACKPSVVVVVKLFYAPALLRPRVSFKPNTTCRAAHGRSKNQSQQSISTTKPFKMVADEVGKGNKFGIRLNPHPTCIFSIFFM
ncbi:hypothetical protein QBC44DRAFT_320460 [Cladorrhinum sp. PSN332]|nr:hypothetical protein QBC44DRAFT_320460 [Cladorrhinum sp. PSN332]